MRAIQLQCGLTPGLSRFEKIGEKGSKWLAILLYSLPLALTNRYSGQPRADCTARCPALYQEYLCSATSDSSLVGTNT